MNNDAQSFLAKAQSNPKFLSDFIDRERSNWAKTWANNMQDCEISPLRGLETLTDLAWVAREKRIGAPLVISSEDLLSSGNEFYDAAMAILALQGARFDFDHRRMVQIIQLINLNLLAEGQLGSAFELCAKLAAGDEINESVIDAIASKSSNIKVLHLVLHGLFLSPHSRYGKQLVEIGTKIIRQSPTDANAWMRRADGHRRERDYAAALDAIDTGIYHLNSADLAIHSDFARHRTMITNEWQLHSMMVDIGEKQKENLSDSVSHYSENLRAESQAMLFRVMEILALFTALIGLLATTVATSVSGSMSIWERIVVIASSSVFLIFFFVMVRVLARPNPRIFTDLPKAE